ncbi:DUF1428 domain-containing protein [Myxococcus sp. CA051A]|uniref:DUF1428 domain-containing protein n=1 Tax=Myxococcus llanfairpwllgwyngyllgogerychwyrndrobwllllantysiliogogogochensis TaxID=2590453 RepID=A0A540WP79_9BACT|nr:MULTISPECIES: DUF1428 domain-containing protein [Myxococcus]NTX06219.1 DUF1428 domain-containing protein [Myxococcus sp. CA040A]NTX09480.1 DUF1428 domain-containing protein [Myxococcus sp. CA056]NTX34846.1 DUF1428 domain-containing protein [Myxococcus sp. CA033]NTX57763.1 DUF1428 domain-containing protein [Myxococcus sp. CA039A]NTX61099.1 DUF1428 domain-containing protein [Myxococcus sp. CA051A]
MPYVDGFVLPMPTKNLAAYRKIARKAGKIWREHGALQYTECVADDIAEAPLALFAKSVKRKPGETVVFSFIVYASKADRNRINKLVMKDPRLSGMQSMPFDMKRMMYGGFKPIVSL